MIGSQTHWCHQVTQSTHGRGKQRPADASARPECEDGSLEGWDGRRGLGVEGLKGMGAPVGFGGAVFSAASGWCGLGLEIIMLMHRMD